jgi:cytochrome P450
MGFLMIRLSKEKKYLDLLVKEIDSCILAENGLIPWEQLKSLMWLDAIVKESLRMNPVVSGKSLF